MNRLQRFDGTEMGMSFTRTHFVNEARRFFNNEDRRTTHIRTFPSPTGVQYRPQSMPALDYDFDPLGYLDRDGQMQDITPEVEDMIAQQSGFNIDTDDSEDDNLEPDNIQKQPVIQPLNVTDPPPQVNQIQLNIPIHTTLPAPTAITQPVYQDPAMYHHESEDPEILAYTWNMTDRRHPHSIYPLLEPVPITNTEATDNPAQALFLTQLEDGEIAISNGRWALDLAEDTQAPLLNRYAIFPEQHNEVPPPVFEQGSSSGVAENTEGALIPYLNLETPPIPVLPNIVPPLNTMEIGLLWNGSQFVSILRILTSLTPLSMATSLYGHRMMRGTILEIFGSWIYQETSIICLIAMDTGTRRLNSLEREDLTVCKIFMRR